MLVQAQQDVGKNDSMVRISNCDFENKGSIPFFYLKWKMGEMVKP